MPDDCTCLDGLTGRDRDGARAYIRTHGHNLDCPRWEPRGYHEFFDGDRYHELTSVRGVA